MSSSTPVAIGSLGEVDEAEVARALADGFLDNPIEVAVFGSDPVRRLRHLEALFRGLLGFREYHWLAATTSDSILGALVGAPPRTCQPTLLKRLCMARVVLPMGPAVATRVVRWRSNWDSRDPKPPHAHLHAVAVRRSQQGRGVGTHLLAAYRELLDRERWDCYLETDREENIDFYRHHGFELVGEGRVLGVENWFMHRSIR